MSYVLTDVKESAPLLASEDDPPNHLKEAHSLQAERMSHGTYINNLLNITPNGVELSNEYPPYCQ